MAIYRQTFTLRLREEIYDKIGKIANDQQRSMNNLIEYVLMRYASEYTEEDHNLSPGSSCKCAKEKEQG
ncbi:MAG: Arc family DNA-binding protein [Clostridiales bacterium]|nr:Arc family DNA-binding protein [Clostridiales bacterium]